MTEMNTKHKKFAALFLRSLSLLLLLVVSTLYLPVQAAGNAVPTGSRLRALAGPFYIGFASANNFWTLSDATLYQDTARSEFNILTPENAMKWESIHPQQNTYSFAEADQHVQFAQQNGMAVHGHTLVWHSQNPPWLANGSWTGTTLTNVLYNHIDTVMQRYQGDILVWDVVNEAFDDSANPRNSIWRNIIGPQYIDLAFQRARAADPGAKLIYNDYNIETINNKSNAVYNMVVDLKSRGIPIDGVGFQMHLTSGGLNYQSFADNMQRFAALGLEIYITEMDVRYPTPISQTNLTAQATVYGNVLDRCLAQPACKALQVWGFTDKYSWVPDTFPSEGDALIFDANYNAKPAYYALQAEFNGGPTLTPTRTNTSTFTPTFTPTTCVGCPTNTFTPTSTSTNTPTITATPSGNLKVQISAAGTDNSQQTAFRYRVQNIGTSAQSNLSVRLYFTTDGSNAASAYVLEKYYDQSGVSTVTGPTLAAGNTYYFTVNYGTASLAAGSTWEYQTALHLSSWGSTYNGTNDWWHTSAAIPASYTDWVNIPAYVSGARTWGSEPTTGPTNTPSITPTASRTNTPSATPSRTNTPTVTTTLCAAATAEPLQVEAVTSPTSQATQVITVRIGNGDSVTVTHEFGTTTVTGNFSSSSPALVTVPLQANSTHHLTVSAHVRSMSGPGGCTYGNYTLTTTVDRFGAPLTIVRSSGPITPTFTPTFTSTFTPTITPTTGPSTLKVQYKAADTNAGDNQIKPHFNIVNPGSSAVPLSELKIRYWYTREGTTGQNFFCDWSAISGGCSNLTSSFVQLNPARTGANFYLEIGFSTAAGSIAAGGQSGEIQSRFAKTDWSNFTETGDYSFDPTKLSFTDWTRVTLYRNGVLVWGVEP
jgi:endo-1,4-beta-xylanase